MILPIVAYGSPVLRKVCDNITPDYPGLDKLIANMWETMYNSNGVGLAAPQINAPIRLFVMDSEQIFENQEEDEKDDYPDKPGFKGVFINAHIVSLNGKEWAYNEGCLSIPNIREEVFRSEIIHVRYFDENWVEHEEELDGMKARIFQHEYDHIEGKLFIDYLTPLKKRLLKGKLNDISKGDVDTEYRIKAQTPSRK